MIRRTVGTPGLALLLLAGALASTAKGAEPSPDPLLGLRAAIEQAPDESSLRARLRELAPVVGFTLSEQSAREGRRSFTLDLASPVPARRLCHVMGWERAYAISPDVHQSSWTLHLWTGDLENRYGPRIAAHTPHVGAWAVRAVLDDRPEGELPKLASGGSPAYDLVTVYAANVTAIEVELWVPGWQVPETVDVPKTDTAPKHAINKAAIQGWIEAHKGLGAPDFVDATHADMRVLAAWNIPTSGWNWTHYWIYCLDETIGWRLVDSGGFQPPEDQAHSAVVDPVRHEVRFLGRDGKVYQRASVKGCRWKRP